VPNACRPRQQKVKGGVIAWLSRAGAPDWRHKLLRPKEAGAQRSRARPQKEREELARVRERLRGPGLSQGMARASGGVGLSRSTVGVLLTLLRWITCAARPALPRLRSQKATRFRDNLRAQLSV
jgi:hypothetical protein